MTHRATVLIIEDERELASLMKEWLTPEFTVDLATTGEQGIAQCDESVDVVLLDRRLPDTSGRAVLDEITDRSPAVRIGMVTGVTPDYDIIDMGFDDYLTKPIDRTALVKSVTHHAQKALNRLSGKLKVLVVDDSRAVGARVRDVLAAAGHQVEVLTDARAFLDTVADVRPDVILLDLIMPDVDGFACLELLQSRAASDPVPVIVDSVDDPVKRLSYARWWIKRRWGHTLLTS
jgi:DNA-binding response OmpR family regulator